MNNTVSNITIFKGCQISEGAKRLERMSQTHPISPSTYSMCDNSPTFGHVISLVGASAPDDDFATSLFFFLMGIRSSVLQACACEFHVTAKGKICGPSNKPQHLP